MAEAGFDPADIADLVTAQADMPDATVIEDADQDDDLDADETMLANLVDDLAFDPSDAGPAPVLFRSGAHVRRPSVRRPRGISSRGLSVSGAGYRSR